MCTPKRKIFCLREIYEKNNNKIPKTRQAKSTVFPPLFDENVMCIIMIFNFLVYTIQFKKVSPKCT